MNNNLTDSQGISMHHKFKKLIAVLASVLFVLSAGFVFISGLIPEKAAYQPLLDGYSEITTEYAETSHVHTYSDASCTQPKTCTYCGDTVGSELKHNFTDGKCTACGFEDPDYHNEGMVWIPTKGGVKYHNKATCSQMIDPDYVTLEEAVSLSFAPCKRCFKTD